MIRSKPGAAVFLLGLLLLPASAAAQRIVLLRPKTQDPVLLQAFGRLQGELRLHQFEVIVVDASDDAPSQRELAKVAERASAVATISLLRPEGLASADVWISDRVTGKTSIRTIETAQRGEAPNVLAIRAVDLLRASLREFPPGEKPPPEVVGASPDRAPAHVQNWASIEPTKRTSLEVDVVAQAAPPKLGVGLGPGIALGFRPSEHLHLQAVFQGPLTGAHVANSAASLSLRQEQLFVQLGYRLTLHESFVLEASGAIGAHHLRVEGEAAAPFAGRSDSAWTALAGPGLGVEVGLSRSVALTVAGRALLLAPRPVAHAADDNYAYGRPLLAFSAGLRVWF